MTSGRADNIALHATRGFYTFGRVSKRAIARGSLLIAMLASGCVRRTITVTSNPSGALVMMNDQEIGRTPFTRDFTWYGKYDVSLRKDGYQTRKYATTLVAPWWQWVPFDFVTELLPLTDSQTIDVTLHLASTRPADPETLLTHAATLHKELRSPND